jgi:hypothetical protein
MCVCVCVCVCVVVCLQGGQLAKAARRVPTVCLILSDVVGNPLDVIGSGPTVPDGRDFLFCVQLYVFSLSLFLSFSLSLFLFFLSSFSLKPAALLSRLDV